MQKNKRLNWVIVEGYDIDITRYHEKQFDMSVLPKYGNNLQRWVIGLKN